MVGTLRQQHASDVRTVMYFFALSLCISSLLAVWTVREGVVDAGGYQGRAGEVLKLLATSTRDIRGGLTALLIVTGLIVVPHLVSYILSRFFGCASRPRLITASLRFLVWGSAKCWVMLAGLSIPMYVVAPPPVETTQFGWTFLPLGLAAASMNIFIAITILAFYRMFDDDELLPRLPRGLRHLHERVHAWATR